nr:DNA-processing protein DprA [Oceanococcus sp. HetDA_MAG_MS8]
MIQELRRQGRAQNIGSRRFHEDCEHAVLQRCLEWLSSSASAQFITFAQAPWPSAWKQHTDAPFALFACGDTDLLRMPMIAIVGSRNPTPQGARHARTIAKTLAGRGLGICSGLAMGVDAQAHLGALDANGATVAVCGRGLDDIYPARNRNLGQRIAREGLLLSEYLPGEPPERHHFPERNRLIASLAQATVVVEATPNSGSLITARQAGQYGNEVLAIPGSVDNPLARGCHQLIREGAVLVENATHILEAVLPGLLQSQDADSSNARPLAHTSEAEAPAEHRLVLDALRAGPATMDTLVEATGMSVADLSSILLILELQGTVALVPGGGYQRISS